MSVTDKAAEPQGNTAVVALLVILIFLVSAIGVSGGLYITGVIGDSSEAESDVVVSKPKPPIYIALDPLVVNFERNGRIGFLQAEIEVMTRDERVEQALAQHAPVIRNSLLLLLSSKTYADVANREGKEQLRAEALAEVNRVLYEQDAPGQAAELYFTGFVMQ